MKLKWWWRTGVAACGVLVAANLAGGQVPAVPAAPVPALPGAPPVAAVPVDAKPGLFAKVCAGIDACRRKICLTPAGAFLNNATAPLGAITGGIIPPFCPIFPSAADLAKPGVAGAADAIKKDALEAKMRQQKVRFLGTVDCRYYPDAVGALTTALRTDGSECVRFEAALALGRGCCCNEKTIAALEATVSGTEADGNPAERSVRVRCAAAAALERCLACYVAPPVEVEPVPVKGGGGSIETPMGELLDIPKPVDDSTTPAGDKMSGKDAKEGKKTVAALTPEARLPSKKQVEEAWQVLNEFNALLAATASPGTPTGAAERSSIYHIVRASAVSPGGNSGGVRPAAMTTPVAATGPVTAPSTTARPTLSPPTPAVAAATATTPAKEAAPVNPPATAASAPRSMPAFPAESMPKAPAAPPTPATPTWSVSPAPPAGPAVTPATASATAGPVVPAGPVAPSTPAAATNPIVPVITQVLQGTTAADRHAAIRRLVRFDWQKNPVVMSALLAGAKSDPVAAVRVDCLRQMAAYQMSHPQVLAEMTNLTKDADQWVRDEAARALAQLKATP